MKAKLIKTEKGFGLVSVDKTQAIASTINPHDSLKLSLKNCQAIERGYDLDELADEYFKSTNENAVLWRRIDFKDGFKKALEILGDKKYSEKDMIKFGAYSRSDFDGLMRTKDLFNEYQSLQQTEWDVSFNPEEKDSEGCLILKRL